MNTQRPNGQRPNGQRASGQRQNTAGPSVRRTGTQGQGGQRPSGQRQAPQGVRRPADRRPSPQPRSSAGSLNDALNERYEEMVAPGSADSINRGKYADLSTFESRGHRKIDPAVMRARRQRELLIKSIPVAALLLAGGIALWVYLGVIRPSSQYDKAVELFEKGDYSSAQKIFDSLGDYEQTGDYTAYIDGRSAYNNGDYDTAHIIFDSLGDFYDSAQMAAKADEGVTPAEREQAYEEATKLLEAGDYKAAKEAFLALEPYRDSAEKASLAANEADYLEAVRLLNAGDKAAAREIFQRLGGFRDSVRRLAQIDGQSDQPTEEDVYAEALQAVQLRDFRTANNLFNELGSYKDSRTYADYTYAMMCHSAGDYATAIVCFEACGDFLDSTDMLYDSRYKYAMDLYQSGEEEKLPQVISLFEALGTYSDSPSMLYAAKDQYKEIAVFAYHDGDKQGALAIFESLGDHPECAEWVTRIRNEIA